MSQFLASMDSCKCFCEKRVSGVGPGSGSSVTWSEYMLVCCTVFINSCLRAALEVKNQEATRGDEDIRHLVAGALRRQEC